MKKKIIFLMTIIGILTLHDNAKANSINFYEAEKIDNIYTKSVKQNTAFFQKARFFRRTSDNKAAYCIEPFNRFTEDSNYESSINPNNIDQDTWQKMSLIAYYGYNYGNHTDAKWYAITQLMIWQEADKNAKFFFTDSLNGNQIDTFNNEINEINNLINEHNKKPSFSNQSIDIKEKTQFIFDNNDAIKYFKEVDNKIKIENNKLDISNLTEGTYNFKFKRNIAQESEPVLFYYNPTSQNLMTRGSIVEDEISLTLNIYKTEIKITKIDTDTKSNVASGDAVLNQAIFELYDQNKNLLKEIMLDDKCEAIISDLDLGTYYIKEKEAGKGYITDNTYHKIELTSTNTKVNLELENKVIEKEISIHKEYGTKGNTEAEGNITFEIFRQNQLVTTITTDELGNAKIKLPYGKYIFKQKNTHDGYNYVEDFEVIVDEKTNELSYNLFDYKIAVPNTRSDINYNLYLLLSIISIITLYYVKQKHKN